MDKEARTNEEAVRESLLEPKVSQGDGYVDITFGPVTFRYRVTDLPTQGQQGGGEDDKSKDKQSSKGQDQQGGQEGSEGQNQGSQGQQDQSGQGGQQGGQGSPGGEEGEGGQPSPGGGGKSKSPDQKGKKGGQQGGASGPGGAGGDEEGDSSGEGEDKDGGEKRGTSKGGEEGRGGGKEGETGPGDEGSGEDGASGGGDKKEGGKGQERGEEEEPGEGSDGSGSKEGEGKEGSGASREGKGPLSKYWGDPGEDDGGEGGEGGEGGSGGEDDNKRQGPGGDPGDDEGTGGGKEGDKEGKKGKGGDGGGEDGSDSDSDSDSSKDGGKGGRKPSKQRKKEDGERGRRPPFSDDIEGIRLSPEDFERIFGKDDEDSSPDEILFGGRKEVSGEIDISSKGSFGLSYGQRRITVHSVGDVSSVKPESLQFYRDNSIAKALRSFLEPIVLAPTTTLDPGVQVFGTPVRRFSGGSSDIPSWSKPRVSFGALSTLESFDLTKLIIAVDVSGSMDANLVYSALRSYFATISSLSPSYANKRFEVLLIVFGDNVVLARIQGVPSVLAAKAVRIAFDKNVLSLVKQGTSAPVVLFPKLHTVIQRGINLSSKEAFIKGSVPVIFITDFLWPTDFSISGDFVNFMRNKPFIGFETISAPLTVASGNKGDNWSPHSLSLKILSLTPYGMLMNFPGPVSTVYVTKEASEKMKKPSGISVRVVSSRVRTVNDDE